MKQYFPIVVLLGCAAAFVCGIVYLFQLRFETGDVYPPYSSLRADPLGTMALYESLDKIPVLSVRRDFSDSGRLPEESQTAYLHLAADRYESEGLPYDSYQDVKDFLSRGGRLVITFYPQTEPDYLEFHDEGTNSATPEKLKGGKMTPSGKKDHDSLDLDNSWVSLEDKWGFHTDFQKLQPDGKSYAPVTVVNYSDLPLPESLDWHSGIVFTNLAKSWQIIYARDLNAVMIERKFGRGSVVIATDSYFVSNEAMAKDRHANLLAWLVGPETNVVFDEAHFGIVETSGVATLMRKYRLHGLAAGLILLAGLFVWKNSTSLVPPHVEEKRRNFVEGKDSASGFVNLLRRSIAPGDLLATCYTEWKKSVAPKGNIPVPRFQQAEAVFLGENSPSAKSCNPVETYKKISGILGIRNEKL
jgi:hypothetical protein